jgi:hypothetical protein
MMQVWKESRGEVKKLAPSFKRATTKETAKEIWQFLKNNVAYVADDLKEMRIKTPARVLYDSFADCKGYSIFIKSILDNLGIPNWFRFVGYKNQREPTHVYVVALSGNTEIPIDACIDNFDSELPYNPKTRIDMPTNIVKMNGVEKVQHVPYTQYDSYIMCPCVAENDAIRVNGWDWFGTGEVNNYSTPANQPSKGINFENVWGIIDIVKQGVGTAKDVISLFKKPDGTVVNNQGQTLTPEQLLLLQQNLQQNNAGSTPPANNDNSWMWWLGGAAILYFTFKK